MKKLIDIHNDILSNLDNVPRSETEMIAIAMAATKEGIKKIIATPYYKNGENPNTGQDIVSVVNHFNGLLKQEQIPVEILSGQVTTIYEGIISDIQAGKIVTLNQTGMYILIDLPATHIPKYMTQLLFDIQIAGYKPIIVHPEKSLVFQKHPDVLYQLVKNGALTQVAASSLLGKDGKKVERFAFRFIEANLVHFVASEAHHAKKHRLFMSNAYTKIERRYGDSKVCQFKENSKAVVLGNSIYVDEPARMVKRRRQGLFVRLA